MNQYIKKISPVLLSVCLIAILLSGCQAKKNTRDWNTYSRHQLQQWNKAITQVIITDVLTPPVCSRVYAYCNIAAYEALVPFYPAAISYAGKLNGMPSINKPTEALTSYDASIASHIAFSTVAQKLVFNTEAALDIEAAYLTELENFGLDPELRKRSIQYGREVGEQVLEWAKKDGYLQRNSHPAYIVTKAIGRWVPTPPDYMDAVEPNWNTLRAFTLDTNAQFRPAVPLPVDSSKSSDYYTMIMEVYSNSKKQAAPEIEIAKFWDCNPNISVTQGHVTYFQQKISPGGHWIHVAASVCEKENYDPLKTAGIISKVAIAIADGFISCWEAKYHYNTIRPETVINRYIDKDWRPLLQTPPFPEYPSGHSVVSGAASGILTKLIGENYTYTDSTELPFGMPSRQYTGFSQAANEASISRLYGGIHFMPALNNGLDAGRKIAQHVLAKLP